MGEYYSKRAKKEVPYEKRHLLWILRNSVYYGKQSADKRQNRGVELIFTGISAIKKYTRHRNKKFFKENLTSKQRIDLDTILENIYTITRRIRKNRKEREIEKEKKKKLEENLEERIKSYTREIEYKPSQFIKIGDDEMKFNISPDSENLNEQQNDKTYKIKFFFTRKLRMDISKNDNLNQVKLLLIKEYLMDKCFICCAPDSYSVPLILKLGLKAVILPCTHYNGFRYGVTRKNEERICDGIRSPFVPLRTFNIGTDNLDTTIHEQFYSLRRKCRNTNFFKILKELKESDNDESENFKFNKEEAEKKAREEAEKKAREFI